MNCMKCGRETVDEQAFCPSCQEVMKQYPVKPGIAIQLPHKKEASAIKRPAPSRRRQAPSPEEIIRKLRKKVRTFVILWLVTLLLLAATIYPTISFIQSIDLHKIGQNYSTFQEIENLIP